MIYKFAIADRDALQDAFDAGQDSVEKTPNSREVRGGMDDGMGYRFDGKLHRLYPDLSRHESALQQLPSTIINYAGYSSIRQLC